MAADQELVLTDELSEAAGRRMAVKLVDAAVTAVVFGHHDTAKGSLLHYQDVGVRWPEDISLIMIGTPEWAGVLLPRLSCIQRPEHPMAVAAAALLLDSITKPDRPLVQQLFASSVAEGDSVRKRVYSPQL